jgi:DNA modification methylase
MKKTESRQVQVDGGTVSLGEMQHDPKNARRHTPRNVGMIETALKEVGAARSIVIDENNVVLAGNATIDAAGAAGIERVQIVDADGETIIAVRRTGLSDKQKARLALYDNRAAELAEWDPDVLEQLDREVGLGGLFTDDELQELVNQDTGPREAVDAEPQLDRADDLQKEWGTELGQIWQLGDHRLFCGDSTSADDVEKLLAGDKPLLMVTDPPYGVAYDPNWRNQTDRANGRPVGARAVGRVTNDDRADWSAAWALFPGDVAYVWHSGIHSAEVQASLEGSGFTLRTQIVWAKSNMVISRGHYHGKHEPCFYAVRKGATGLWAGDRTQTSLWEIDKPMKSETGHSTQKPVECMARPIRNHDSKLVYEPFCGSGTTIIACEQLGRSCRAMEISPGYTAVILQRFKDATGQMPVQVKS